MLKQGKHAHVKLYKENIRVFKTYENPVYTDNEYFALDFLANQKIMNLNPKKENSYTISMDWINEAENPAMDTLEDRIYMAVNLAAYLKTLHNNSYRNYNLYITHEDLFLDNCLVCKNSNTIYFIDWGLSKKRNTVYPDTASVLLGIFNDCPEDYSLFLKEYFESHYEIELIEKYVMELYQEYCLIREENGIETDSLKLRLKKAQSIIKQLSSRGISDEI